MSEDDPMISSSRGGVNAILVTGTEHKGCGAGSVKLG